ncbi:Heme-binding protein 2 [Clonorchis sinensis]|uniref:Heme-binding protein 2 n=2 Tax=Clonorchis sinensis TaxID=79923 RepID=A0A8T1MUS9_CLOSI|nr:Heme-binding protein 2 [Clonorchis sinensis]
MFLSRSMPEDAIHIVNSFGCENIIECFVDSSTWLTYSFSGMRYQDGWVGAENLMLRYFDGENSQNEKLPFGCPMVTKIDPSEGPACESQLTFAAALPNKWTQVPQPRTDELTLSQWPKLHVYARPFLGPNKEEAFRQESLNFADSLRTTGLRYQTEPYFWVVPDPPNEPTENLQVWFLVEEP